MSNGQTITPDRPGDTLGYARVSTNEQDLAGQRDRLEKASAIRVFTDIMSGGKFERLGDRLCVTRLDRLGRSLKELLEAVEDLQKQGIHLVSLEESKED